MYLTFTFGFRWQLPNSSRLNITCRYSDATILFSNCSIWRKNLFPGSFRELTSCPTFLPLIVANYYAFAVPTAPNIRIQSSYAINFPSICRFRRILPQDCGLVTGATTHNLFRCFTRMDLVLRFDSFLVSAKLGAGILLSKDLLHLNS